MFRLIGNIPGPIVYGIVFDSACKYFRYDIGCGTSGNCWVYDNTQLSWSLMLIIIIGMFLNFFFGFLTWITYPKLEDTPEDPEKTKNENVFELTKNDIPQSGEEEKPEV